MAIFKLNRHFINQIIDLIFILLILRIMTLFYTATFSSNLLFLCTMFTNLLLMVVLCDFGVDVWLTIRNEKLDCVSAFVHIYIWQN